MTQRGFLFLFAVAIVASLVGGKLIEPYTAPGLERTVWFGVILAAVLYPAGLFAERRGWVRGKVDLGRLGKRREPAPAPEDPK
ncbi:MAG: hypothetical protein U1E86_26655 [Burkholderiaceae bacterium]